MATNLDSRYIIGDLVYRQPLKAKREAKISLSAAAAAAAALAQAITMRNVLQELHS